MTEKDLEEFRKECGLMMDLRPHRNVVPLLGVCYDPKTPCMVTDYLENGTLERLIKSSFVLTWPLIVNISKGITAGVYHLHQENILHRDLASRNILLRGNYEPLIADFGLSKKVASLDEQHPNPEVQTKEAAPLRGPYKWMAPESLGKNEFSVKSDAFSFGVVIWEILARSNEPYPTMDIYQAAKAVQQGLRLQIPPRAPPRFVRLLQQCWAQKPEERPDFLQIMTKLDKIQAEVHTY